MIITRIWARELKGRSFDYVLSPGTLIVGPNFAGKTAIIEAIRLVLMGYIPEIGKLPKSTWELSSAHEMTVAMEFDNGASIVRTFKNTGKPIVSNAGAPDTEDLPLLHADYYFGLTDTERTNYVFERIKLPDTYSAAGIVAEMQRLSLEDEHSEAVETAKRALIGEVQRHFEGAVAIQEPLAKAVDELREKFTYWNRRAKETQGAVTVLTELKLKEKQVSAENPRIDQDLAKLRTDRDTLLNERGQLRERRDAAERAAGRMKMLQKELDRDRIDYARMIEADTKALGVMKSQMVTEPTQKEIREAQAKEAELAGNIQANDALISAARAALAEVDAQLEGLKQLEQCPICKAKGKGWKKHVEEALEKQRDDGETKIAALITGVQGWQASLREASETLTGLLAAQAKNAHIKTEMAVTEDTIERNKTAQATEDEKRTRYAQEIKELGLTVKTLTPGRLPIVEEQIAALNQKIDALEFVKISETRLKQDLLRATEAEAEHRSAKAYVTVIKALADLLKDRRQSMVSEAFTRLLQTANTLTAGILKSPLVMVDNTIGRYSGAKFVPHRVFSGTEKALTYIAISVALSSAAPFKLVILDEFGRLDRGNQVSVFHRLTHLQREGVIDQFIVVGTEQPDELRAASVIELE